MEKKAEKVHWKNVAQHSIKFYTKNVACLYHSFNFKTQNKITKFICFSVLFKNVHFTSQFMKYYCTIWALSAFELSLFFWTLMELVNYIIKMTYRKASNLHKTSFFHITIPPVPFYDSSSSHLEICDIIRNYNIHWRFFFDLIPHVS